VREKIPCSVDVVVWYAAVSLPIANSDGRVRRAAEKSMEALVCFDSISQRLTEHSVESVDLVVKD
jgi:hypothetical protein